MSLEHDAAYSLFKGVFNIETENGKLYLRENKKKGARREPTEEEWAAINAEAAVIAQEISVRNAEEAKQKQIDDICKKALPLLLREYKAKGYDLSVLIDELNAIE